MKEWLLSVCAVTIVTSLSVFILPEGKIGNYIKSIFAFITVLVIISPVVKLKDVSFSFDNYKNTEIGVQTGYLEYFNQKLNEGNKEVCKKIILESGLEYEDVNINYVVDDSNEYSIKNVKIILSNSVIKEDGSHINIIEDIKNKLSQRLCCEKGIIDITINSG